MKMNFKIKNSYNYRILNKFIKKYHLKSSRKREQIINYFLALDRHISTEELYNKIKDRIPKIGYSTVYRTLKLLVSWGLATACQFEKGITRFEPVHREDHHDHLICTKCGAIIEFKNFEIERMQIKVADQHKFQIKDHKLEIYGLCQKCSKGK